MATATAKPPKTPAAAPLKVATGKASTAVALKKPSGGSIVSIQEAMKTQLAELSNRIAPPSGNKIRATQDKQFILPDGTKTPGPLELVIVDFAASKNFYENAFDKDNIQPPECFAVGNDPKKMFPSDNVPVKQADNCQICPNAQWGSKGKGKACGDSRLLAVLPPDADADTPIWLLQPSATAIKGVDGFIAGVARTYQSMPVGVITTVSFDPNQTYATMVFSDPKPNPNIAEHYGRLAEAKEILFAERDVSGYEAPVAKPTNGRKVAPRR